MTPPRGADAKRARRRSYPIEPVSSLQSPRFLAFTSAFALSAIVGTSRAHAEPPSSHEIGAGLHLSLTQVRDDLLVPLRFAGPGAGISFGYAFDDDVWRFESRLRTSASALFDRYGTPNIALLPSLDISSHRHVTSFGDKTLALGASLSLRETVFYPMSWDDAHAYWLGVTSLGPSARMTLPAGDRHIALELGLPVVGLVSRPPRFRLYKVDNLVSGGFWFDRFAAKPKLTSLHEFQAFRLRAVYQGNGHGFRIDPFVELDFETFSEPARFIHTSLTFGAEARFGL